MKVIIPDFKALEESRKENIEYWGSPKVEMRQSVIPTKPFSQPGVPEDSTILVFAGNTGEVSFKLKAKKIIFTDLIPSNVKEAKSISPDEFRKRAEFIVCDATSIPLKDNCVDFAFSFEPYPLIAVPHSYLELIRCARKGIILAYCISGPIVSFQELQHWVTQYFVRKIEWIDEEFTTINIQGYKRDEIKREERSLELQLRIIKIRYDLKKSAATYLKIIKKINEVAEDKEELTKEYLEKARELLGMREEEFTAALKRITSLMLGANRNYIFEAEY